MRFAFHAAETSPEPRCRQLDRTDYCVSNAFPVTVARMAQRGLLPRQAIRAKRRREAGKIDLLERRTLRPGWQIRKETRSRYDHLVATGEFDRAAWADIIRELLEAEAQTAGKKHGSKTRFAARVGVSVRTVDTWLRKDVDVKESNVRAVAEAYDRDLMELLIRVGFYAVDDLPYQPTNEEIDEEQRQVLDSDLDDETKAEYLRLLDDMRTTDERLIAEQRERDKQRRMRELAWRIEQASRN